MIYRIKIIIICKKLNFMKNVSFREWIFKCFCILFEYVNIKIFIFIGYIIVKLEIGML